MRLQSRLLTARRPLIAEIPESTKPFTYFKDKYGFIFWAHRFMQLREIRGLWATMVYSPDNNGDRYCVANGLKYTKTLSHGLKYELPSQMRELPELTAKRINKLATEHPITGEQLLFVPWSDVREFQDHRTVLNAILANEADLLGLSDESLDKVKVAVGSLERLGIPLSDLGLYGALQSNMAHTSPNDNQVRDIDILIYGTEHYDTVMSLAPGVASNRGLEALGDNRHMKAAFKRRRELTQPRLKKYPDTKCDIRMIRKKENVNSFPSIAKLNMSGKTLKIVGKVVDANESLVIPYVYKVQAANGEIYSVCGRYYHYIGAATKGDEVEVVAKLVTENTLMIIDPINNYIKCSNCK